MKFGKWNFLKLKNILYNYRLTYIFSFYYGNLSREQVKEVLIDSTIGTFLIRDSTKGHDQKVLCVK